MSGQVAIHCDTEHDDGSFCIGATSTNAVGIGSLTFARWERSALDRGWTKVDGCHYCPTCSSAVPDEPLMNYTEAAAMCGVPEEAVRQWRSRRYLKPADYDGQRPLFRPTDVRAVDTGSGGGRCATAGRAGRGGGMSGRERLVEALAALWSADADDDLRSVDGFDETLAMYVDGLLPAVERIANERAAEALGEALGIAATRGPLDAVAWMSRRRAAYGTTS